MCDKKKLSQGGIDFKEDSISCVYFILRIMFKCVKQKFNESL